MREKREYVRGRGFVCLTPATRLHSGLLVPWVWFVGLIS